jgi:hypothetical protein
MNEEYWHMRDVRLLSCIGVVLAVTLGVVSAPALADGEKSTPYTIEFYYKIKWGYFDEFKELFQRNHYPILQRLQENGHIISMAAHYPVDHAGESDRWDMRFTIVYKDIQTTVRDLGNAEIIAELYPDKEKFDLEEQERFEMIIEHRDVPVWVDDLEDWNENSDED